MLKVNGMSSTSFNDDNLQLRSDEIVASSVRRIELQFQHMEMI